VVSCVIRRKRKERVIDISSTYICLLSERDNDFEEEEEEEEEREKDHTRV